jgi:AraC-like DNA-binding protein
MLLFCLMMQSYRALCARILPQRAITLPFHDNHALLICYGFTFIEKSNMEDLQKKFILALLAYGVKRNLDPVRVCELSGFKYTQLTHENSKPLTAQQINNVWNTAIHLTNDHLFGLHFAESMQLAALGVVGQIVQTSATVGDALAHACAFTHMVTDMFTLKLKRNEQTTKVMMHADDQKANLFPVTHRQLADYLMVFVMLELNGLLMHKLRPVSANFPFHIANTQEYQRIFECPLKQSDELSLEFRTSILDEPILSANYDVQNFLLQKVSSHIKVNESDSFHGKIYNMLIANSYLQMLSLEAIAGNLNMSGRSLQRKLKEEGSSYQQIVEEVRKNLAIDFISSGKYSTKDLAATLGYNETSAFLRAFKRWTGQTPRAYMQSLRPSHH